MVIPPLLGALVVALLSMSVKTEVVVDIAVIFDNQSDDMLLAKTSRQSVKAVVSGTKSALKAINPENAFCRLDLAGLDAGTHTIMLQPDRVELPKRIDLMALLYPSITVRLEAVSSKAVAIIATLKGKTAAGFAVSKITLNPDRVSLRGPVNLLAEIDTVKTRPIDLGGASESFKKEVPLNLSESIGIEAGRRIVIALVDIKERIVTRVLEDTPIAIKGVPASYLYRIDPDVITLTVSGPENIVGTIEQHRSFAVAIDLRGLGPGTHSLMATINLPVRTTLVQASPEHFLVNILE
jgi:YbbR domain-containing protein